MAHGRLRLTFAADEAATHLRIEAQEPPLRVIRHFRTPDGAALTHLHNVSGGVLGGDRLEVEATVGPGARVQLTTTGATRVYRPRATAAEAVQSTRLTVAEGGLLEYLPDPLIPFAGARYRQQTEIALADDAGLFYWEILTPGREAYGETFAYERVRLELALLAAGRPLLLERLVLEPALRPLTATVRLGAFRYVGSLYVCRVGQPATRWANLEAELSSLAGQFSDHTGALWGVSALRSDGLVVRAAGQTSRQILAGLVQFWQCAKQTLYGVPAYPPRKIY
jgi:urease accessory protein